MALRIAQTPEFTRAVVEDHYFSNTPFVFVDVGAAGGFRGKFNVFGDSLSKIGFEPNAEQFAELNEGNNERIFRYALGDKEETRNLNLTRSPVSHSLLRSNQPFWERMWAGGIQAEVGETEVETVTFDALRDSEDLGDIDYMKIDTEGTELEILRGSEKALRECVIAVECEIAFYPMHHGRALFSDVDTYMRSLGFTLFALDAITLPRRVTPRKFLTTTPGLDFDDPRVSPKADFGQVLGGDALYVVDFLDESNRQKMEIPGKLAKTVAVFDIHHLPDCALELVGTGVDEGILPADWSDRSDKLFASVRSERYKDLRRAARHLVPSGIKPFIKRFIP